MTRRSGHTAWRRCGTEASDDDDGDINNDERLVVRSEATARAPRRVQSRTPGV